MLAFLVEKKFDDFGRRHNTEFTRVELPGFAEDLAQDVVADAAGGLDDAFAGTGAAGFAQLVRQRLSGALARHLEQPQRREAVDRRFDAVSRQLLLKLGQYLRLMIFLDHVDEIDDDDAAQVAQPQLASNGLRSFQIGLENRVIEIARANKASGVDINGGEGLGLVDDQVTARFKVDAPAQRAGNFLIDIEQVKNRPLAGVVRNFRKHAGHEFSSKIAQLAELLARVDANALRRFGRHVAQYALQQVEIAMQQ